MKQGTSNFSAMASIPTTGRSNAWTTTTAAGSCSGGASTCALGTGSGSAQNITIYGRVPSIGTAPPTGIYTDTVTMTITY